jgi:Domain of unknown function (DUF4259)
MGTWGVAVFSDDLAADLRDEFRDLIGEGLSSTEAVDKLLSEHASSLEDDNEKSVFWLALAVAQWKLGRLEERTKKEALRLIAAGEDLKRWDDPKERKKRAAILEKLREQLLSPQPPAKRVARTIKGANDWAVGEVVGLQLKSGNWTLLRVIGHHEDKGGRHAVCELLDWVGQEFPLAGQIAKLPIKRESTPSGTSQFLFQEPITGKDRARVKRLGLRSRPAQRCGEYSVLVWPYVDRLLKELFGLE